MDKRKPLIDYSSDDLKARGWVSQKGSVLRSRNFADRLFSVSNKELQVIDASNRDEPLITASLTLSRNIVNFVPLINGYGLQLVKEEDGVYTLRAVPLSSPEDGNAVSELNVAYTGISYIYMIGNGNMVYFITDIQYPNDYSYSDYYPQYVDIPIYPGVDPYYYTSPYVWTQIQVYDFSEVNNPRARGFITIPGIYTSLKSLTSSTMTMDYSAHSSYEIIQIKDDVLVFNQLQSYNYRYGYPSLYDPEVSKEIMVVNLSVPDNPKLSAKVPLTISNPGGFFAKNNILYFSYELYTHQEDQSRPQTRYYLGRIDLTDPDHPVELDPINIPGFCIGLSDSGEFVYTINKEWDQDTIYSYAVDYTFNAVKIFNDKAYLFDKVELNYYFTNTVIDSYFAYLSGPEYSYPGYNVKSNEFVIIDLADPENLAIYEYYLGKSENTIFEAKKNQIFISFDGIVGSYNLIDPQNLQLEEFRSQGYASNRIIYHGDKVYLPLGDYGLWVKNL